METIASIMPVIQIIISVLLIAVILLQKSGSGLGGALGENDSSVIHTTKRGFEKVLFQTTIVLAILFALSALASILIA